MSGGFEALAASQILDPSDPTLLTYEEIKRSFTGCENFMLSYGLKPYKEEDCEEARQISRMMKQQDRENETKK